MPSAVASSIHPQNLLPHLQTPSRPPVTTVVNGNTPSIQSPSAMFTTSPRSPPITRKHARTSTLTGPLSTRTSPVSAPVSPPVPVTSHVALPQSAMHSMSSSTGSQLPPVSVVGRTPEKLHRRQRSDPSPFPHSELNNSYLFSPKHPLPLTQMSNALLETPSNLPTRNHALSLSQPPMPMVHRTSSVGSLSGFNVFAYLPEGGVVDTTPVPRYGAMFMTFIWWCVFNLSIHTR